MDLERVQIYLEVLACPKCKKNIKYWKDEETEGFFCETCQLLYPIVDEIPEMLIESARDFKVSSKDE